MEQLEAVISVNLDSLQGSLLRALQRTIYLVATGLQSPVRVDEVSLRLEGAQMHFSPAQSLPWSAEQARSEYGAWILAAGFRDVTEAVNSFLEEAYQVCTVYAEVSKSRGQRLTVGAWNGRLIAEQKRFHRANLPDKFRLMAEGHDITLDATLHQHVMRANVARNCLVHRGGVVAEVDLTPPGGQGLIVSWRRMVPFLIDADGEKPLVLNQRLEKEATVAVRIVDQEKSFSLGSRVAFDAAEFSDIAFSMSLAGSDIVAKIARYAERTGAVAPQPSAA